MTTVNILPVPTPDGITYQGVAGNKRSHGATVGQALDALAAQLPEDESQRMLVVRGYSPDKFFTAEQQRRLAELMGQWRSARELGNALPSAEQAELENLVELEL